MLASRLTRLLAPALVVLALAALGATTAVAAPGEVAYDCKLDICLLNPDKPSEVFNLTDNEGTSIDEKPVWSPDGKKVAFISNFDTGSTQNLYVMEPEAPDQSVNLAVQVTHFTLGQRIEEPVWSPDGTRLAFVVDGNVQVANADGTTATPVNVAAGESPTWAPEGGKIAYSYQEKVYAKNADGSGAATPLPNGDGVEPAWSPDGSRVALGAPARPGAVDLSLVDPSGAAPPITLKSGAQFLFGSWSPSGAQIAYQALEGTAYWRVANADGTGDHALPRMQDLNPNGPAPSWSPSGTRLVYQGYFYGTEPGTNGVYMSNADGSGEITALVEHETYSTYPAWKPSLASAPSQFTPAPGSGGSGSGGSGGSSGTPGPLPVTMPKPKTVWITKRIFVTKGPDYTVIIASYGCGGPRCSVATSGTARGASPAGLTSSLDRGKARATKAKPVVVGTGKTTIAGGQSGPVKLRLNKAGAKLLEKHGSLKIDVTLTVTIPGQKKIVEHHSVTVVLKGKTKASR